MGRVFWIGREAQVFSLACKEHWSITAKLNSNRLTKAFDERTTTMDDPPKQGQVAVMADCQGKHVI